MIETPSAAITVSASASASATHSAEEAAKQKEGLLETGPTITLVHQKPITSSIRRTLRHLVENAGKVSRWRGFKLYILYALCFSITNSTIDLVIPRIPGRLILVSAISGAAMANLHATWTHKIISMPTQKTLRERFVPLSSWKQIALPAAVDASATYISVYICMGFYLLTGLDRINNDDFASYTGGDWASVFFRLISVIVASILISLLFIIPARVTLIRVEASLLPEDQDTIVPFDRTFNGKVVAKILGGTGAVGFIDAWKSFNWEARWRVIKLYVKIFAIVTGMLFVFVHVLAFELYIIMGPALGEFISRAKAQGMLN